MPYFPLCCYLIKRKRPYLKHIFFHLKKSTYFSVVACEFIRKKNRTNLLRTPPKAQGMRTSQSCTSSSWFGSTPSASWKFTRLPVLSLCLWSSGMDQYHLLHAYDITYSNNLSTFLINKFWCPISHISKPLQFFQLWKVIFLCKRM